MITTLSTSLGKPFLARIHVTLVLLFSFWVATAQFRENHQYILGGSLQANNDLDFINLSAGRVLSNGNVIGLSGYADSETFTGVSGWHRIVKAIEVVSIPVFYKMDTELGYFDDSSIGLFLSPGFTLPLTKRSYLDLSVAAVRLNYESELSVLVSLNNVGIGLIFGI